ncbi:TIGR01212 family radical SAM protein [Desulfonatronovibrio magnus]|uniref:TIGR01212 family radical SAM protein n=1 Tax=Desulfonatronovibrio magnus TaxID=698827 RepID=UPI0005EB6221|nr:TIGR01212 family radical SAM protein [Desulfonatronovibrio magnus]RQD55524.1 MAG: TIGR01212 family radical SAM protein [Desulfonatronovibrio sp. MSAO_Bac4]
MEFYNKLSSYWKKKFGTRVRKVPLDAGFSCPNRDGTISFKGCTFCNEQGSGTGLFNKDISLKDQYNLFREKLLKKNKSLKLAAYLQSYSNTYCSSRHLTSTLEQITDMKDLAVLCLGTRPDCLNREKCQILASFPAQEIWLDLGLQSSDDLTLQRINRGHKADDFALACTMAHNLGIKVCAHVIAGLPGENIHNFRKTINFINDLPVQGIKIHNLYVCRGTAMAQMWYQGEYTPLSLHEYISWTVQALSRLRPDIVIHRLTGDPAPGELLAPDWAAGKMAVLNDLNKLMAEKMIIQGSQWN